MCFEYPPKWLQHCLIVTWLVTCKTEHVGGMDAKTVSSESWPLEKKILLLLLLGLEPETFQLQVCCSGAELSLLIRAELKAVVFYVQWKGCDVLSPFATHIHLTNASGIVSWRHPSHMWLHNEHLVILFIFIHRNSETSVEENCYGDGVTVNKNFTNGVIVN